MMVETPQMTTAELAAAADALVAEAIAAGDSATAVNSVGSCASTLNALGDDEGDDADEASARRRMLAVECPRLFGGDRNPDAPIWVDVHNCTNTTWVNRQNVKFRENMLSQLGSDDIEVDTSSSSGLAGSMSAVDACASNPSELSGSAADSTLNNIGSLSGSVADSGEATLDTNVARFGVGSISSLLSTSMFSGMTYAAFSYSYDDAFLDDMAGDDGDDGYGADEASGRRRRQLRPKRHKHGRRFLHGKNRRRTLTEGSDDPSDMLMGTADSLTTCVTAGVYDNMAQVEVKSGDLALTGAKLSEDSLAGAGASAGSNGAGIPEGFPGPEGSSTVQLASFKKSPHGAVPIDSEVMAFDIKQGDGDMMEISNLTEPLMITIRGKGFTVYGSDQVLEHEATCLPRCADCPIYEKRTGWEDCRRNCYNPPISNSSVPWDPSDDDQKFR